MWKLETNMGSQIYVRSKTIKMSNIKNSTGLKLFFIVACLEIFFIVFENIVIAPKTKTNIVEGINTFINIPRLEEPDTNTINTIIKGLEEADRY